jgi:hypothetical protein
MRQFIKNRTCADEAAGGGKLNLLLSGFSRQDIVPVEDIVRAIDLLPGFHLEGLREIVYLPGYAPAAGVLSCPAAPRGEPKGEFVQRERRIFVYGFDSATMFLQMLHHEIGHFVFFLVIGSRVKKRWVTEVFPGARCVTPYASVNPWEDFAETYAYYLLHSRLLEMQFPEKHAFMRDSVFSGSPWTLKERDRDRPGRRS